MLVFKSDNDGLFEYTNEVILETKFKVLKTEEAYIFDEENDAMTEYEKKFRNAGQNIHRIIAQK